MRPLTNFFERAQRLGRISSCLQPLHGSFPLLKVTRLNSSSLDKLRNMVNLYLLANLEAFYKGRSFHMHDRPFDNCISEILGLPNITPNGLILPKQQTYLAYNQIHAAIVEIINLLNLEDFFKKLRDYEKVGDIGIIQSHRSGFGSTFQEAYSIIVWRPL